jgi:AcrR family transcriptional regulator
MAKAKDSNKRSKVKGKGSPKVKQGEALDGTTEEKIKNAALKLFTKKGFAATRTRDISEEAGINLALLNYYFRSKEKLFDLVMAETLQKFFMGMHQILNDESTTVDEKVAMFVDNYTEMLKQQPDLPLFIFHELKRNPDQLASKIGAAGVFKSYFIKQLQQGIESGKYPRIHPLHFVINMVGMAVFPFIGAPLLKHLAGMDQKTFYALMDERKVLIPKWVKAILKTK